VSIFLAKSEGISKRIFHEHFSITPRLFLKRLLNVNTSIEATLLPGIYVIDKNG
jgi:hypothetical protein